MSAADTEQLDPAVAWLEERYDDRAPSMAAVVETAHAHAPRGVGQFRWNPRHCAPENLPGVPRLRPSTPD